MGLIWVYYGFSSVFFFRDDHGIEIVDLPIENFGDFPYVSLPECMREWFWYLLVLFVSSTKNQEVQLENRSASMSDCARVTFFCLHLSLKS